MKKSLEQVWKNRQEKFKTWYFFKGITSYSQTLFELSQILKLEVDLFAYSILVSENPS